MDKAKCEELLNRARQGDTGALGVLFRDARNDLHAAARAQMDDRLKARVDASDVLQQTLLDAQKDFRDFRGSTAEEWQAWIRRVLEHNMANEIAKHVVAQKRAVGREQSARNREQSSGALYQLLDGQLTSPSQKALKKEATEQLQDAIDRLPVSQAAAIRMRYIQNISLSEMAEVMGRSESAVAGLIKRGIRHLKSQVGTGESSD